MAERVAGLVEAAIESIPAVEGVEIEEFRTAMEAAVSIGVGQSPAGFYMGISCRRKLKLSMKPQSK